jgi:hypothetical protein
LQHACKRRFGDRILKARAFPESNQKQQRVNWDSFFPRPDQAKAPIAERHSGMVRQHQTRNLEIPGSMFHIAPE